VLGVLSVLFQKIVQIVLGQELHLVFVEGADLQQQEWVQFVGIAKSDSNGLDKTKLSFRLTN
jgi:hypothetical protein